MDSRHDLAVHRSLGAKHTDTLTPWNVCESEPRRIRLWIVISVEDALKFPGDKWRAITLNRVMKHAHRILDIAVKF